MATALDLRHCALADFLVWEEQQPEWYERVDGVVQVRIGDTVDHNRITLNVAQMLERQLWEHGCEVFTSTIKVTSPTDDVMYPDVVVVCSEIPGKATEVETRSWWSRYSRRAPPSAITAASGGPIKRSRRSSTTC